MIIKQNYLYTNNETEESALGGDDCLLVGAQSTVLLQFMVRNGGKVVDKYVSVFPEEWDLAVKNNI